MGTAVEVKRHDRYEVGKDGKTQRKRTIFGGVGFITGLHTHPAGTNPWGELVDSEDESSGKGSSKKKDGASGSGSGEPQLETYTYDVRYILGKSDTNVSELEINNMADTASGDSGG
eukprot:CAMPEP_0119464852 /NCGR_PEP_ID=MMETSP1344-20130328/259_1 /TAXON_ID=236787 /ORGANISM="Florenciella parvula, Strain CCMP2471" /LENGTH=115 /DNA_ID=CAMNT_0007497085 /DNA_START=33 /DNA_END=376 /DNA_ORIENTATION=-